MSSLHEPKPLDATLSQLRLTELRQTQTKPEPRQESERRANAGTQSKQLNKTSKHEWSDEGNKPPILSKRSQDSTCVDVWSCSHLLPKTPSFSSMGTALCRLRYQLSNKYCQHKNARNKQKVMVCRSKAQRGHLNALWWGHAATRPGRLCFQSLKVGLWDVPVPAGCSRAGPRLGSHGGDGKGGVTHVRNISTQLLQEFLTFFFRAHGDHTQFTHPL